jgi:hypothetical protein
MVAGFQLVRGGDCEVRHAWGDVRWRPLLLLRSLDGHGERWGVGITVTAIRWSAH